MSHLKNRLSQWLIFSILLLALSGISTASADYPVCDYPCDQGPFYSPPCGYPCDPDPCYTPPCSYPCDPEPCCNPPCDYPCPSDPYYCPPCNYPCATDTCYGAPCDYPYTSDSYYGDSCYPIPSNNLCHMRCSLYGDFIYWQVHPEGTEFARYGGFGGSNIVAASDQGCIYEPKCNFEPGFRVGLIYNLGCCEWDFFGQYTYLYTNLDTSISVSSGIAGLSPLIWNETYGGTDDLNYARGKWNSHLNVFDFGFGRTFDVNCCFDFRPFLGCKATWQRLQYQVTYEQIVNSAITTKSETQFKTDFDGIGLRGGFEAAWKFIPCFSIVGSVSVSGVYSDLCTTRKDYYTNNIISSSPTVTENINVKKKHCVLLPVAEWLVGIQFDNMFCGCYNIYAFAGWENQVWWNLNQFLYVSSTDYSNSIAFSPNGGVTYQGLTVRGGICY